MLGAIGNTPLVRLCTIVPDDAAAVLVKVEYYNPTGSYKDRMALSMIERAERRGALKPGMTVVEYTGIFAGTSTGLNVAGALAIAREIGDGHSVVTVAVDSGFKYLAGDLYAGSPPPA
jgi:cysteine synthase